MSNVVQLIPCANTVLALRNIADMIERGDIPDGQATVIIGSEVFHTGCVDNAEAATEAIWNMTYGTHKLMSAVFRQDA